MAKEIKNSVYEETCTFPASISFSKRIYAIAENAKCVCKQCGKVHGDITKEYCSNRCYNISRIENAPSKQQVAIEKSIETGNKKFVGKIEGTDYLVCAICGAKTGDLGSHVKMHDITPAEYKIKYNMEFLKPLANRENRKGENNPAYNHGGKYSAWSEKFIYGYDQNRHTQKNLQQRELRAKSPEKFKNNIKYWLEKNNGDVDIATAEYKKYQTRNLSYFVEKYGQEDGIKRHTAKTEKWVKTMNDKPIDELTIINSKKVKKSGCFFSKGEKELFHQLKLAIPELSDQLPLCRSLANETKKFYLYDMQYKNKIIEYNGDFWHANPKLYDTNFINPYTKKTQQEIISRDADKLQVANNAGYSVHVVWEHEYKKDKNKVIQECLKFLTQ